MDNKEEKVVTKTSGGIKFLIVLLCLIILGLGGYLVYDKCIKKSDNTPKTEEKTKKETTKTVKKVDESKEYVYDADYEKNVDADSYTTNYNETYYAKDIVVPYINIKTEDATSANTKIKEVFDNAIKRYNDGVNNKTTVVDCNYTKYINNDYLSVLLKFGVGGTDVMYPDYYSYSFNLKTGKKLSYEDVYKLAGFDSSNIESKVEESIKLEMKNNNSNIEDEWINKSIENYKEALNNNTLEYALSENGELNIVVAVENGAGRKGEGKNTVITIK